jgi:hypothetical protein
VLIAVFSEGSERFSLFSDATLVSHTHAAAC